jgi:adenine phosphoribosyltransferase
VSIRDSIRTIPNHPKPGILFRDVTPLFGDARAFAAAIDALTAPFASAHVATVAGIEARGFIVGAAVALRLGAGFAPLRKPGKLPFRSWSERYELEYGSDALELHVDALPARARVLLVDDLLATGGTADAALRLLARAKAEIVGCAFLVDLPDLGGRQRLEAAGQRVHCLCDFEGE